MTTFTSTSEKNELVLDAISKLARQFSESPDFESLVNILLLTISGQFASPSALIVFKNVESFNEKTHYHSLGAFTGNKELEEAACSIITCPELISRPISWLPKDDYSDSVNCDKNQRIISSAAGLCARSTQNEQVVAFLCVGPKVTGKPFDQSDCDMLSDLISTVSPLLVNTYLLATINQLNRWQQEVLDNVAQGLYIFDETGLMKHINEQGCMILSDIIGDFPLSPVPADEIFPERSFPGWSKKIKKAALLSNGRNVHHLRAFNKDGEERIFRMQASTLEFSRSENRDLVVTLDDVTWQKQSESKLFEVEKLAEKGVMASSISHELNNFLGLILGGVELSVKMLEQGKTDKAESYLVKLRTNVKKMERYTASLTDDSRLDAEKTEGCLNNIINDVVSFATLQKRFSGITIETELAPELPQILLDSDQISQVLMNLLNNAADAIAENKQNVGRISIYTRIANETIHLFIADNGIGIEPERMNDLFKERFTTKKHGHGFGLVTCGKIINSHGGTVKIESEPGYGSTFKISFPMNN